VFAYPIGISQPLWNNVDIDTLNESLFPPNAVFTAKHAGYYSIHVQLTFTASFGNGDVNLVINPSISGHGAYSHILYVAGTVRTIMSSVLAYFLAGETLDVSINNATGAVLNQAVNDGDCYIYIHRVT